MKIKYIVRALLVMGSTVWFVHHLLYSKEGHEACEKLRKENALIETKIEKIIKQKENLEEKLLTFKNYDFEQEKYRQEELLLSSDEIIYVI